MKLRFIIGILFLALVGCTSTKKTTNTTTRSDSVNQKQTTKFEDTTAKFHIQGQMVQAESKVALPDSINKLSRLIQYLQLQLALKGDKHDFHIITGLLNSDESYLKCPYAESWAQVVNGVLKHRLEQTDTTIDIRLKNAIRLTNYFYSRYRELTSEKETIKTSFWTQVWIWCKGILVGLLLAIVIGFILKLKKYVL